MVERQKSRGEIGFLQKVRVSGLPDERLQAMKDLQNIYVTTESIREKWDVARAMGRTRWATAKRIYIENIRHRSK